MHLVITFLVLSLAAVRSANVPARCDQPLVTGRCRAYFLKWGWKDGECQEFVYGGCGGNRNRFSSKLACEKKCRDTVGVRPSKPNRCLKVLNPSEGGDMVCGDGSVSRWGYDKTTGNCVQFQWNGCKKGSNNNRFRSAKACRKACKT